MNRRNVNLIKKRTMWLIKKKGIYLYFLHVSLRCEISDKFLIVYFLIWDQKFYSRLSSDTSRISAFLACFSGNLRFAKYTLQSRRLLRVSKRFYREVPRTTWEVAADRLAFKDYYRWLLCYCCESTGCVTSLVASKLLRFCVIVSSFSVSEFVKSYHRFSAGNFVGQNLK